MYKGPWSCIKHIIATDGARGLFRGMGPPVIGNAPINALVFAAYGEGMRYYTNGAGADENTSLWHHFAAGKQGGLVRASV